MDRREHYLQSIKILIKQYADSMSRNPEPGVDEDLEEMGISKQEIVVGLHHPSMREYSDFAAA